MNKLALTGRFYHILISVKIKNNFSYLTELDPWFSITSRLCKNEEINYGKTNKMNISCETHQTHTTCSSMLLLTCTHQHGLRPVCISGDILQGNCPNNWAQTGHHLLSSICLRDGWGGSPYQWYKWLSCMYQTPATKQNTLTTCKNFIISLAS